MPWTAGRRQRQLQRQRLSASFPPNDNGTHTVKGTIQDKDGGVNEYTASVTVNNVAPPERQGWR